MSHLRVTWLLQALPRAFRFSMKERQVYQITFRCRLKGDYVDVGEIAIKEVPERDWLKLKGS